MTNRQAEALRRRPIAALAVAALLGAAALMLPGSDERAMRFGEGAWTLPAAGSDAARIAPGEGGVDLLRAEAYVLAMPFDHRDDLVLSPDTAVLFARLADWLAVEVPPDERARTADRIALALPPGKRAAAFEDMLARYRAYREEERAIIEARLPPAERVLRIAEARIARFGEARAAQLFAAPPAP